MEDSELEPLAASIQVRPSTKPAKGLWSARRLEAKAAAAASGGSAADLWSQSVRDSQASKLVYSLLAEARTSNEEGRFVQGLGAYREAANLSRADKALKDAAFETALKEGKSLTAHNWRVALSYLREASELDTAKAVPANVRAGIEQAEREETIANAIAEIKLGGDAEQAYSRLSRAMVRYPGDLVLESHLPAVSLAVITLRGPAERKKRLAIMQALRAGFERSTESAELERFAGLSESSLGPYRTDAEIWEIFSEIQTQASAWRKASIAFAEGRIANCLQVCSQALSAGPEQNGLVGLRKEARAFAYVDESAALTQASELFAKGPLSEAHAVCRQAQSQFPDAQTFAGLEAAIGAKESSVRSLLESGEASLLMRDVEKAGAAFQEALQLLPLDPELGHHLSTLLHNHLRSEYARTDFAPLEMDQDKRTFDSTLELLQRLQPGKVLPPDLSAIIQQRKQHSDNIRIQAEATHKTAERGLQADVLRESVAVPPKPRVAGKLKTAAKDTGSKPASTTAVSSAPEATLVRTQSVAMQAWLTRAWLDKTTIRVLSGVAAIVLCATFLAWHDHQNRLGRRVIPVVADLPAGKAPAHAAGSPENLVTPGVTASPNGPVATLEIRGAEPGTAIRVDNILLGAAVPGSNLTRELSSGDHVVELSREGYNPKRMALHFAPGEVALLTGSNVQLQATDSSLLNTERHDWNRLGQDATLPAIEAFLNKYPQGAFASAAKSRLAESKWRNVDKSEPAALQAFLHDNPANPFASDARDALQALNRQSAIRTEELDWQNVNKGNPAALTAFLSKYPGGSHSDAANGIIADLKRQSSIQTIASNSETIVRADVPRREEHKLAVVPAGPSDPTLTESAAVLDVIGRFASAWNAKDYRSIVAIEPDLNKRVLKAQLSPVKEVVMRISPVGPPQISGTQATVVCRRQADETFSDGSLKQNPESIVTYVLSKRNGSWGISAIR